MAGEVDQILGSIQINNALREQVEYDPNYGFLRVAHGIGEVTLLGFGALTNEKGELNPRQLTPVVDFNQVPLRDRTIDKLGKGVGPRLYNTAQALAGLKEQTHQIGLYQFTLNTLLLTDTRTSYDNTLWMKARRIGTHAARMLSSTKNLEATVEKVHRLYGGGQAVLMNQPPHARHRQENERGIVSPVDPALILIRDPEVTLTRVAVRLATTYNSDF